MSSTGSDGAAEPKELKLLLVAEPDFETGRLDEALRSRGYQPAWTRPESLSALRAELFARAWNAIVAAPVRTFDVLAAVPIAKRESRGVPFLVVGATPARCVEFLRAGADDCVMEHEVSEMGKVIERALQRAETERAQHRAERRFRSLIQHLPQAIMLHRDRCILYANPICLRYLGLSRIEEVLGRDPVSLVIETDRARVAARLVRLSVGQSVDPIETELLLEDRRTLPVEVASFSLDQDGEPAIATVARDLSREREMQQRVLLADRMVSVGMLAAGVAHEVNNPLAYIQANLEFALEQLARVGGATLGEVCAALEEARQGATRVRSIVRDVKTFSRPEEQRVEVVDVRPLLESAINMSFNEIRHRARLVKDYGPVPQVSAVRARLGQVFLNLIVNAAQAIPEGAVEQNEIRLSTSTDEKGRAVVAIRDTGSGMPPEVLRHVFDPFFTTKATGVGSGLGLSISNGIVSSLGGEILVSSAAGAGSEFRVLLPPAPPAEHRGDPAPATQNEEPPARILAIDDDQMVGNALRRILAGHVFEFLQSGKAALERIEGGVRYDVILLDLTMPQMSGMRVHAELMRIDPAQAARVIFITGGVLTAAAHRFLDEVPNLRLHKPFDAGELRAMVHKQRTG
jgi:two-component system cell cycle sensor histidine kinase/response regulator CckA